MSRDEALNIYDKASNTTHDPMRPWVIGLVVIALVTIMTALVG